MRQQQRVSEARKTIRNFIRMHWDDRRLHEVYAFNADGKMSYFSACRCIMGVTLCEHLHDRVCADLQRSWDANTFDSHYNKAQQLEGGKETEDAYSILGWNNLCLGLTTTTDATRRVRLSTILRAEIRRRARENRQIKARFETIGSRATSQVR